MDERKLQIFEKKVLREIPGPKNDKISNLRYYITSNFVIHTVYLVLLGKHLL